MRAVMFLDPYGMQVEWTTIELIAAARHIDLWYLFPVGIVQRLLHRRGKIIPQWEAALDRVLGDREWRDRFYAKSGFYSLFPENDAEEIHGFQTPSPTSTVRYDGPNISLR